MKFIFIDGSYFIFFRFNALKNWWSLAHRDEGELFPAENDAFKDKFRTTFADKLKEIPKKVGIKKGEAYRIFVGQDCRQETIWRMKHRETYKDGRSDTSVEGQFFSIVYREKLFEKTLGENCLINFPSLEADDVIAISTKYICSQEPSNTECFIISSDGDYLQLCAESFADRIHIYDLKFKDIKTRDLAYKNRVSAMRMFVAKKLSGDKSDNIPSAFAKCGNKTARMLAEVVTDDGNDSALIAALEKRGGTKAVEQYKHNDLMMNFNKIPADLVYGFLDKYSVRFDV